jgi:DNA-binding MarR family transcriptional regulator
MAKKNPTDEQLFSTVSNLMRLIRQELQMSGCFTDLSKVDFEILKYVREQKEVTMKAIADYLYVKPSSATTAVETLVKRGDLKRVLDAKDRRIVRVQLSKKGEKTIEQKHTLVKKKLAPIFKGLSEKDKKAFVNIIETIIEQNNYDNA